MDTTRTHYSSPDDDPLDDRPNVRAAPHVPANIQITFNCPVCEGMIEMQAEASSFEFDCPHCGSLIMTPAIGFGAGMVLDDFKLIRRIGRGAMGEVYLAKQQSLSRDVAVKILSPGMTSSPEQVERFQREVQNLARLQHPNIVSAFYSGCRDDIHYLAMTYVDGENLHTHIRQEGTLSEDDALSVIYKVADALRYAWEEFGFIHRDIKPANIMIDRRGEVKLTDLGLSKFVYEESSATHGHRIFGTPHYMSPEQARGELDLDMRTDMYSLGITFYHMLTGAPPFNDEDVSVLIRRQVRETPRPIRDMCPGLSDGSDTVMNRLIAKSPNDRYDSWDALLHAIADTLTQLPPAAHQGSSFHNQTREVWLETTLRKKRRRRTAAILTLLFLGSMAWLTWEYAHYESDEPSLSDFARTLWRRAPTSPDQFGATVESLRDGVNQGGEAVERVYQQWSEQRLARERKRRVEEVLEHLDEKARAYLHTGLPDFAADVYIEYDGPWAEESREARLERADAFRRPAGGLPHPDSGNDEIIEPLAIDER